MKGSQLNVILKYRRPADCWLCSECETENNMLLGTCSVCGAKKDAGAVIVPAWSERDEYAPVNASEGKSYVAAPVSTPPVHTGPVSRLGGTAAGGHAPSAYTGGTAYSSTPASGDRVFKDVEKYPPVSPSSSGNTVTLILSIVLAVVVFGIIIAIANA